MAFVAVPEMLMLLMVLGGPIGTDIVAMIDPAQYFEARRVELSINNLARLAAEPPKDAKTQVQQLLALRYLAEQADKLKQADRYAEHRKVLEAIAAGKQAQDAQGFARAYAELVLARLDGKNAAEPPAPSVRDALTWFPADVHLVAAIDTAAGRGGPPFPASELLKTLPPDARAKFYEVIEKSGNVRVDRLAIAYRHDDNHDKAKIYIRIKGKANPAWVTAAMTELDAGLKVTERQDEGRGTVTLVQREDQPPVFMLFGDSEMMIVGYSGHKGNHLEVAEQVLAVRAGKEPPATAGALKARLQKIPERAMALFVGDLNKQMFGREPAELLGATPAKVDAHVVRLPVGYDINVTATMADAGEAQTAVMKVSKLRKDGIDMLKQPAANPRLPVNSLVNLLESLQMQSEGNALRLQLLVPRELLQSLPAWALP